MRIFRYFYHGLTLFYLPNKVHILVIRLSAMGDVAMTVPVLRALSQQHPNLKITVVSKAFLKPLFAALNNVHFFAADVKGKHKGIMGLHKLYKELKQLDITHIADLHNVLRSKIVRTFFAFSHQNIAVLDKGRTEKKALTSATNKVLKQLKTTHQRYADVFDELGFQTNISSIQKLKKSPLLKKVQKIVKEKSSPWIGIAPFAAYDTKMYPFNLMKEVIEELAKNNRIFLFGGGQEEIDKLKVVEQDTPNCISIAGILNLQEELNLISQLDCMVAMDSGNAHFAAMLEIPTITIWGATHPYAGFAPFNQPNGNCLLPDMKKYPLLPTSIYGNKVIEGYEDVMQTISPKTVIKKVLTVLKTNS